jgi:hypothetical protein
MSEKVSVAISCLTCQHCFTPSHLRNADVLACRHETMRSEGNRLIGNMRSLKETPDWCPKKSEAATIPHLDGGVVTTLAKIDFDIATNPGCLQPFPTEMLEKALELTRGIIVNLDEPL